MSLFLGNVVYAVGQWLTLIGIARFGDPEMVGQYALGLAISAPVILAASLALRTVQVTDTKHRYRFMDYLSLRLWTMLAAFAAIAAIAAFLPDRLAIVVLLVGLAKCCDGVGDIFYGAFQRVERMAPIGISLSLNGVLTFALTTIVLAWQHDLAAAVAGSVIASVLSSLLYCWLAARRSARGSEPFATRRPEGVPATSHVARMVALARSALALGAASAILSVTANVPRYFLGAQLGSGALGIFTAISVVVLAANTLVGAAAQSRLPGWARAYATQGPTALRPSLVVLVTISLVAGGILTGMGRLIGRSVLNLVYGPEYADNLPALLWTLASIGIVSATWFVNIALSACRRFNSQLIISLIGLGVALATTWPIIGRFGITGAAVALVISAAVQLVVKLWVVMTLDAHRGQEVVAR